MTKRKPLQWHVLVGGGLIPDCAECATLLYSPMFMESVYSVSIEHPGEPVDLARRTINQYHANKHNLA